MKRKECLVCQNDNLTEIINLGSHAYADTFISEQRQFEALPVYMLFCNLCKKCGQIQTGVETKPEERYGLHNYSYTSANSASSKNHWKKYTTEVLEKLLIEKKSTIIEIGSNDGFLLSQFKKSGHDVLGVDASDYMCKIAIEKGIPSISTIFNEHTSKKIKQKVKTAPNLIVANNVFNHSDEPISFAKGVNNLLKPGGYFVFELPYWRCSIESMKIDQIYHEHVSYFTARSSKQLMNSTGFEILDIEVVDYHGGSIRVYAKKVKNDPINNPIVDKMIQDETHLFELSTYQEMMSSFDKSKHRFVSKLINMKSREKKIVAVGAAAKGNTFLTYLNLDTSILDYVTDASRHKQGKYTPLTNIPIVDDSILKNYDDVCVLILSWNLAKKLGPKLKKINPNLEIISFYEERNEV